MRFLAIIIVFCFFLGGCTGSNGRALNQADAIMEQDADSALHVLESIDRRQLSNGELPYFALLMTQAQVKTDVPLDSDSLISIAYKKYDDSWRGDKGIRTNFYMGEVFFNQGKPRDAMRYYLTAYEESKRLHNDYWRAKSAERIADLFFNAYNYAEAEKYMIEAAKLFGAAHRGKNHLYALATLGIIYINNQKDEQAKALLDSLYNQCLTVQPTDSNLLAYIRRPIIDILVRQHRLNEITVQDISLLENTSNTQEEIDNSILLMEIKKSNVNNVSNISNNMISFEQDFPFAMSNEDKALAYYANFKHEKEIGNPTRALSLIDSLLLYQSALAEDMIKESVKCAETDFYSHKADYEKRKSQYILAILALTLLVFILIIIIGWHIHKSTTQKQLQQLESVLDSMRELDLYANGLSSDCMELKKDVLLRDKIVTGLRDEISSLEEQAKYTSLSITRLRDEINVRDTKVDRLEKEIAQLKDIEKQNGNTIENLFKEKWDTLNLLCDEYYERGESDVTRKIILKNLEKEIKKLQTQKHISNLEKSVDTFMDGLISRLRIQCPFLKEEDIAFLTLIYAGYSVRAVCLLTNIKYRNFYLKKHRLSKKILDSDAPDRQFFIDRLKE